MNASMATQSFTGYPLIQRSETREVFFKYKHCDKIHARPNTGQVMSWILSLS